MRFITMGFSTTEHVESSIDLMAETRQRNSKPVMTIVSHSTPEGMRRARDIIRRFQERGIPAFPSLQRGAYALRNALDYYTFKRSLTG